MVPVHPVLAGGHSGRRLRFLPLWKADKRRYNLRNIVLLFCLLIPVATAYAADAGIRMTSTVRADLRTGRLVRRTVVTPAAVPSREIAPRQVQASAAAPSAAPLTLHNVDVHAVVEETARANDVDPLLIHSVIKTESNYNPVAVSPKGAMGLMQLMPGTARRFGASNTFDVRQNIEAGVKYLRYLQGMFRNDRLALAAYNAGEGAVLRYGDIPPYRETENYVYKVGKSYGEALRKQKLAAPPPAPAETNEAAAVPVEPLRQLEIARDAEGRIVLRTR